MRVAVAALALAALAPSTLTAQERRDSIAFAGGPGIYVWLGGTIVSPAHPVEDVVAHRVERRRADAGAWESVAEVSAVRDARAFLAPLDSATRAAVRRALGRPSDETVWSHIVRYPRADSLSAVLGHETIRLALGLYALDRNVRPGDRWQYRVSRMDRRGNARDAVVTNVVSFPTDRLPDSVRTVRAEAWDADIVVWWDLGTSARTRWLEVWRRAGTEGPFELRDSLSAFVRSGDSLQATYLDDAVQPGGTYQYYAVPRDFFFNAGPASDTITAYAVDTRRLAVPDSLAARGVDSLGIVLMWRLATPGLARSIRVYRSERQDGGWYPLAEVDPAGRRFADERVEPMRLYYYRLTVLTPTGDESPPTAAVFGYYASSIPPEPPAAVWVDTAAGAFRVHWSANRETDLKGYHVYRTDGPVETAASEAAFDLISTLVPAADSAWTDTTFVAAPGRGYTYAVRAVNTSDLQSAFSAPAAAPADGPVGLDLPPPTSVTAVVSDGRVRLTWDGMSDAVPTVTGYVVLRRHGAAGPRDTVFTRFAALGRDENAMWDTTVAAEGRYEYVVRSVEFTGRESANSMTARVELTRNRPAAPGSPRALPASDGIELQWGAVSGLDAVVRIYRYERGNPPRLLAQTPADSPSYLDRTAQPGVRYYYHCTFVVGGVEGERSPIVSARR